jgi:bifunctional DNase/RNase
VGNDFKDLFGDWRPDDEGRNSPEGVPEPENRGRRALNEKEVKVVNVYEGIYESPAGPAASASTTFVLLRDNLGREFRIFVLRDVAYAISMAIENEAPDRPFTHDLMKTMLERLGATVDRITIDDLWQDTFYAKISIVRNNETLEIDARPSDAIAISLRFRAPIYVAESVLDAAQTE